MGRDAWLKIPTLPDGTISLEEYRNTLRDVMKRGVPIACVIASGGDTLNMAADSPAEMKKILEEEAGKADAKTEDKENHTKKSCSLGIDPNLGTNNGLWMV